MPRIEIDRSRAVSDQELFNQVARHLFTQGQRALNAAGACCYRDAEGRSCALGCRIPDSEYVEDLEDRTVWHAELRRAAAISKAQIELMGALQFSHDLFANWETTKSMKGRLSSVANKFNLSPAVLDTLAFSDR